MKFFGFLSIILLLPSCLFTQEATDHNLIVQTTCPEDVPGCIEMSVGLPEKYEDVLGSLPADFEGDYTFVSRIYGRLHSHSTQLHPLQFTVYVGGMSCASPLGESNAAVIGFSKKKIRLF